MLFREKITAYSDDHEAHKYSYTVGVICKVLLMLKHVAKEKLSL